MALKIYLKTIAHLFVDRLRHQVADMTERHEANSGVKITILEDEFYPGVDRDVGTYRFDDGSLYKIQLHISHPPHEYENPLQHAGYVTITVTPLEDDIDAPNIEVRIDYDPMEEPPELLPYFVELFEPMEKAWGGVLPQLEKQCPLLALYNAAEPKWNPTTENWDIWFGYYHAVQGLPIQFTLEDLAEKVGYSYGVVRNKHSEWLKGWAKYVEKLDQK